MSARLSKRKYNLLCVAHPDDETIFFGGLLQQREQKKEWFKKEFGARGFEILPWTVICVTSDGNEERRRQFAEACRQLEVDECLWWNFPDRYEARISADQLISKLQREAHPLPEAIFTHSIIGDYGHPHHQDVSFAVHHAFQGHPKLYSVAYNCFPEFEIPLTQEQFDAKSRVLTRVYGSETNRFLNVLPSTFIEGFRRIDLKEIDAVYGYMAKGFPLRVESLAAYAWLESYLPVLKGLPRPF